jgi:thiol-disulfide isomerase/thioredoxin
MRKLVILLILLAAVIMTAGCNDKTQAQVSPTGESGNSAEARGATVVAEGMQDNPIPSQGSQDNDNVVEVTQLEQIDTSLQKGPVLVKIGAEWCGPCQELKPILKDLAMEYAGKATIMSIDADESPKLATDYFGSYDYPDSFVIVGIENGEYVYMQADGKVNKDRFRARILGLRDKQEFENVLDFALQKGNAKST